MSASDLSSLSITHSDETINVIRTDVRVAELHWTALITRLTEKQSIKSMIQAIYITNINYDKMDLTDLAVAAMGVSHALPSREMIVSD